MANPFDVVGSGHPDFWQNLMNFGMATMAAGAQPGARTLGAIGQGGLEAMKSARENALARTQNQLYGAEAQGKMMTNAVALNQINMQRMGLGLPPLDIPGMGQPDANMMQPPAQVQNPTLPSAPTSNTAGMPYSSTPGRQVGEPSKVGGVGSSSGFDPMRLSSIGAGREQPSSAAEAAAAAPWANMMGYTDRAKQLNEYALAGPIDSSKVHQLAPGGALYQNGQIMATGPIDAVTPEGGKYRIPAQVVNNQEAPIGIRNNNPGNIRPSGDKWQGMSGEEGGYLKFSSPEAGIRAASKNLQSYADQGINTPLAIANRWAPEHDGNDPGAYAFNISRQLGIKPNQPLNLYDPATNAAVVHAIIQNENGFIPYDNATLSRGVQAAFKPQKTDYGTPEGTTLTEIPPGVRKFKEERGGELSKKMAEWDEKAEAAKQANFLLSQMEIDAETFTPGKFADARGELGKYIRTVNPKFDGSVAGYERFVKNAITLTNEEVRQVSNRAAVQEYQAIQSAQPQPEMSPLGIKNILAQKYAINDYQLAKQQAANKWLETHPTVEGFENEFNKNVSPAVFLVSRMSPQELQEMKANMLKKPEGQRVLNNLIKKIQYGQQMGILE